MTGTPKTLKQAISNGWDEARDSIWGDTMRTNIEASIEQHVLDFIRQKIGAVALEAEMNGEDTTRIFELMRMIGGKK